MGYAEQQGIASGCNQRASEELAEPFDVEAGEQARARPERLKAAARETGGADAGEAVRQLLRRVRAANLGDSREGGLVTRAT
ncbi:MAG: hypothetical protein JOY65_10265 [Acetobacteraceae bacterium]|nr:hypothetical protein [Acetobacteraceae bacterium]